MQGHTPGHSPPTKYLSANATRTGPQTAATRSGRSSATYQARPPRRRAPHRHHRHRHHPRPASAATDCALKRGTTTGSSPARSTSCWSPSASAKHRLGAAAGGIRGAIDVDDHMRTRPGLYAAGLQRPRGAGQQVQARPLDGNNAASSAPRFAPHTDRLPSPRQMRLSTTRTPHAITRCQRPLASQRILIYQLLAHPMNTQHPRRRSSSRQRQNRTSCAHHTTSHPLRAGHGHTWQCRQTARRVTGINDIRPTTG